MIAIGLSNKTPTQIATTQGTILSAEPYPNNKMVSDVIAWGGDSGGGLFSRKGKLVGIISKSQVADDGEATWTFFAPASQIKHAWVSTFFLRLFNKTFLD